MNNSRWYLKLCILAILVRLDDFRTSLFRFSGFKVADWRKQEERKKKGQSFGDVRNCARKLSSGDP